MAYTHPNYLISTAELAEAIDNSPEISGESLRIFDATIHLVPAEKGYKAVSGLEDFQAGHIPGATFLDIAKELSDTTSGFGFTLPSDDHLQAGFRAAGINQDSKVVIYASGHMMWATRAWWMLHASGHKNVSVLDGGFAKWQAEERAQTKETSAPAPGNFTVTRDKARWADKAQVLAAVNDGDTCTINALSPGVYTGDAKMSYGRKGHIENSKNVFYDDVLEEGCFKSNEDLKALFTDNGVLDNPRVIAYCGGGISATIDALALLLVGHGNVAVYDGSMSEWAADKSLPLITGSE
jgi:thiosulfate/3-mercaptopyruvate sulfurtransferase